MKLTFKGKPLNEVMVIVNASEANPYKAVEMAGEREAEAPYDAVALLEFIEENYPLLLELCTEAHAGWLEEQPKVIH